MFTIYYLFFEILIYGILFGFVYALISAGFSLVFGVSKILNLSYGALYMTTAYLIYYFVTYLRIPLIGTILISIFLTLLIGLLIFYFVLKFTKNPNIFMVTMLLFALLLQYLYSFLFGGEVGFIIPGPFPNGSLNLVGVSVSFSLLASAVISLGIVAASWIWIEKSALGRKIRATSEDAEVAELVGINTRWVTFLVLTVSIIFIAVASVLVVPSQEVTPDMWINPFVIAFAVSIIGGLGKFKWVIPSAMIVSFSEVISQYLIRYNVSEIAAFVIVIIFIIIFPNGLGGGKDEI
ncbi:MAG: branched-chain amino acid ABC transporter permease [Nitrososphaeria archaeon]